MCLRCFPCDLVTSCLIQLPFQSMNSGIKASFVLFKMETNCFELIVRFIIKVRLNLVKLGQLWSLAISNMNDRIYNVYEFSTKN